MSLGVLPTAVVVPGLEGVFLGRAQPPDGAFMDTARAKSVHAVLVRHTLPQIADDAWLASSDDVSLVTDPYMWRSSRTTSRSVSSVPL
eukprot:m.70669 g.70669  ORF g.70669 m.70669 type:complete len:88 (+) comp18536_c1_seq2:78-341(+)